MLGGQVGGKSIFRGRVVRGARLTDRHGPGTPRRAGGMAARQGQRTPGNAPGLLRPASRGGLWRCGTGTPGRATGGPAVRGEGLGSLAPRATRRPCTARARTFAPEKQTRHTSKRPGARAAEAGAAVVAE